MAIVTESVGNPVYNAKPSDVAMDEETVEEKSAAQSESDEKPDEKADESDSLEEKEESTEGDESEAEEDDDSSEKEDDDSDKEDDEEKPKEDKKPKRSGIQRRINKLNARIQAANEQAEMWRQEALKNKASDPLDDESKETVKADGKPVSDNYETYDEYMEALADWKAEQKLEAYKAKVEAESLKAKVADRVSTHNSRVDAYRSENSDFDSDLADFFEDQGDDFKLSMAVEETITDSEIGPQLLHELIKNPEEFERINSLGAMGAARAIGRLESKIEAESSKSSTEKKVEAKKTTNAPKPLAAVKAKGSAVSKSLDQMSQKEYEAYRMSKK